LYPYGSDSIANGAGDSATERTNAKGLYSADVTEALSGWHDAVIEDGSSNVIGNGATYLEDNTDVHRVEEAPIRLYDGLVPDADAGANGGLPLVGSKMDLLDTIMEDA
jgi:hypothetical protein